MDSDQQRAAALHPPTQTSSIPTVFLRFIIIGSMVLIPLSPSSFKNNFIILHQIPEGYIGVYWRGGALLPTIAEPGFHLKMPFITQHRIVQVTLHTEIVTSVSCGTKGGVMINFDKIEVVNQLHKDYVYKTLLNYGVHYNKIWMHDKIRHEINKFCNSHSLQQVYIDAFDKIGEKIKEALQVDCTRYGLGIEIFSVHVTKPAIPDSIRRNFEQLEEERIKVSIAVERQKVAEKESETSKKIAISEAQKNANISKILMEQKLLEKDSSRRQEEIENQMFIEREKCQADANFYQATREAEANRLKLTPAFLELKYIEAIGDIAEKSPAYNLLLFSHGLPLLFQSLKLSARFFYRKAQNMMSLMRGCV